MKRSKFTESQIMDALKRVDAGLAVPEVRSGLRLHSALFLQYNCDLPFFCSLYKDRWFWLIFLGA